MLIAQPSHRETQQTETVEQFLARGGKVERIEDHPDPEGRVLRRGQRADAGRSPFTPVSARRQVVQFLPAPTNPKRYGDEPAATNNPSRAYPAHLAHA
jgi:hypothetical protein